MKYRLFVVCALIPLFIGCQPPPPPQADANANGPATPPSSTTPPMVTEEPETPDQTGSSQPPVVDATPSRTLCILAWNIESGGADPAVIAQQLQEMSRYDIYVFSEVHPLEFSTVVQGLGSEYFSNMSQSGNDDRLAIAFDKNRFDFVQSYEIEQFEDVVINPGNYRSPYVFELTHKDSGVSFSVMANHLARGKAEVRETQAVGLRRWGAAQTLPTIAIGDFNFDYEFESQRGNPAMDLFLAEGTWIWVKPEPMIDSNWFDGNGDGVDDYEGSLLDFAFVTGPAKNWPASCRVIVREGDFPDDHTTSDHRPIELLITIPQ